MRICPGWWRPQRCLCYANLMHWGVSTLYLYLFVSTVCCGVWSECETVIWKENGLHAVRWSFCTAKRQTWLRLLDLLNKLTEILSLILRNKGFFQNFCGKWKCHIRWTTDFIGFSRKSLKQPTRHEWYQPQKRNIWLSKKVQVLILSVNYLYWFIYHCAVVAKTCKKLKQKWKRVQEQHISFLHYNPSKHIKNKSDFARKP